MRLLPLLIRTVFAAGLLLFATRLPAATREVRDAGELRQALQQLTPGTTLRLAPGEYPGGQHVTGVERLTLEAADPQRPPVFRGGATAWQFSRCAQLTLRHLKITGQTGNGLNLDDGGERDRPVPGITLEHLEISDIGPIGNHDGIKCSGLTGLTIRDCTITGWGGQGIDFVGCRQSRIVGCTLTGKPGFSASAGVQLKGGSQDIVVERCTFRNAGSRPLNVGGSTGIEFFRPPGAGFEAARIEVRDNLIEGGDCAAAFVGVDGATFAGNTVRLPARWIFRLLQETAAPGFVPCRNVSITGNTIRFRRAQVRAEVNVGAGTAPETLQFRGNRWFAEDRPQASRPQLPVPETGGEYGPPAP